MKNKKIYVYAFLSLLATQFLTFSAIADDAAKDNQIRGNEKVVVLWTSADKEVATHVALMYAENAKKFNWWKDITLVIWGPSQKLFLKDKELQEIVERIRTGGVTVKACKGCADKYGNAAELEKLNIIVEYIDLTGYIKEGRHVLTF